ncbi:hypothetical protein [Pseudosulfitobacter sp. SM2401]|uniref:hypothetical protein n=1 Tax=Pseudosulfitobacter sp. SM2401 TaxID=3350098 RepID=UPI0036F28D22
MSSFIDPATTETLLQVARLVIAGGAGGSALAWLNHSLSKRRLLLEGWFAERQSQLLQLAQLMTLDGDDPTHSDQFKRVAASAMVFCGSDCRNKIVGYSNLLETRLFLLLGREVREPMDKFNLEDIEANLRPSFEELSQAIRQELLRQPPSKRSRLTQLN